GGGPCNGGNEEANAVEATARATGGILPGNFLDSAGDGFPQRMILEGDWQITLDRAHTGSASYNSGASTDTCIALTTPELQLDFDAFSEFTFWSSMNINVENESWGMVDISVDGGATWAPLDLTPGTTFWNTFIDCLPFEQNGYAGYHPDWTQYSASLAQYQGKKIVIRFHYGTLDPADLREGWSIDDIRITNVLDAHSCGNAAASCNAPPVFDGVKSVTDDGAATCGITVAWDPAVPACGQYPDLVYNVYRDTDPDFVPGPSNLVASCLETTTYPDADVVGGARYFYVVRAEDRRSGGGAGRCGTGIEDGNIVKLGAAPSQQPPVLGTWFDDAGDTGPARMTTNPIWRVSTDDAHSGTKSYFAPNDNLRCDNLVTPPLELGSGSMLTFWSDFEGPVETFLWAAGTIEVTSDGGNSWTRVTPIGGYPEHYNNNVLCDLAWEDCFGDYYPWAPWTIDLSAYADQTVQVRFHFTSHNFYPDPTIGWHVDDIEITNVWLPGPCTTQAGCPLAVDVRPDAPPAACTGSGITFSAAVSGGTAPFTYQWTEDGSDIPGATGPSHTVSRLDTGTHSYNCRLTDSSPGCTERTDPVDVTAAWTAQCAPHVVLDTGYDPAGSLVEMCGDGDAFVEPGERWSALARLRNTGNAVAADVQASLVTNPASVVDAVVASGVASFGDIDPGLGALNFAERFQFCPVTTGTCGSDITFDVNGVTWTGGGNPPTDFPYVLQVPVGVSDPGEDVWHDLTPADPLNATFETVV
ncbi:MAG: immune inhibitor A, partial [Acidobacteriota bacterium]|nr:immune inhibitor A [Acidobacteriota bacterium]